MNWNNGGKTSVHKGIRTSDIRVVFTLFTIGVIAYIWGRDIGRICFFQIPNEIRGGGKRGSCSGAVAGDKSISKPNL